ncbi:hypothetical protein ACE939_00570 [Aquimarina sp. W85]|uniref:hypothetical protein n=1 Tax=Aquimarina rhodophyticola TaxID=3342246 RepID=UPI00366BA96B
MDLQTTLIGLLMIVLCTIPFYLLGRSATKKRKKLLAGITDLAAQHYQTIDTVEYGPEFSIATTQTKEAILFYKKSDVKEIALYIDLDKLLSCTFIHLKEKVQNQGKFYEHTKKLALSCKTTSQEDILLLEFYNVDDGLQLNGELELLTKWHQIINKSIKMIRQSIEIPL